METKQPVQIKKDSPPSDKINFTICFNINDAVWLLISERISKRWVEIKDLRNNVIESTDIFSDYWATPNCDKCYGRGIDGKIVNKDSSRTPIVCECVLKYIMKNLEEIKKDDMSN